MSKQNISVGIDIGTYHIKALIAEDNLSGPGKPKILGVGQAESKGLRHGYIVNQSDAVKSIRKAIDMAEKAAGVKVTKAFMAIGGIGLAGHTANGATMISRADSEISDLDVQNVIEDSEHQIPSSITVNRKMVHTIPISYKIDGKEVFGNPVGMKGVKLEVTTLFISTLEHHLQELIDTVEAAGIEVIDAMAAPLAASLVSISKPEKIAGCVLANFGSETVSIVVFENDIPISIEVFPVGSNDITNDIALGLKISLEQAEELKISQQDHPDFPRKKLDDIITGRLTDMFSLIEAHLKKIGKSGMLPAGIIVTGGGSGITTITDLAKAYLKLPSKATKLACDTELQQCMTDPVQIKDGTWAVAYGLTLFGLHAENDGALSSSSGKRFLKSTKTKIGNFFKQFLP